MVSPFEEEMGVTYKVAKEYLKTINKWDDYKDQDGYTIVYAAKYYKEKKMEEKIFDDLMDVVGGEDKVQYVCFIMDHSGSMLGNGAKAISNFNEQVKTLQKETGEMETLVTVIEFSDRYKIPTVNEKVQFIKEMNKYPCNGMTALYDSIAAGINEVQLAMNNDKRKDKAALVFVQTDGYENSSVELKGEKGRVKIQELIKGLEASGIWTIVFLGENIDKSFAGDMGIAMGNTMNFADYKVANVQTVNSISGYYSARRAGETQTANFYDETQSKTDK